MAIQKAFLYGGLATSLISVTAGLPPLQYKRQDPPEVAFWREPAPFGQWTCIGEGDVVQNNLNNIKTAFNYLFGDGLLTTSPGKCYQATCDGFFFAWCNESNKKRGVVTETANARKFAYEHKLITKGDTCKTTAPYDVDSTYYFGRGSLNRPEEAPLPDTRACDPSWWAKLNTGIREGDGPLIGPSVPEIPTDGSDGSAHEI